MKLVIFQLITIAMMTIVVIGMWLRVWKAERDANSFDETFWCIQMQRMGKPPKTFSHFLRKHRGIENEIQLPLGIFFAGNRWTDTIYMGTGGQRVRLFLNVQKTEIVLTVLEGQIQTRNGICEANKRKQITLGDFSKVIVGDLELQFFKKR